MSFQIFANCPFTKFVKQDKPSIILVNLAKLNLWILNRHSPFRQSWNSLLKLLKINPSVISGIDCIKKLPIIVVLLEIQHKIFILSFGDIVIAMGIGGFEFLPGGVEGSDDHWLYIEDHWKPYYISKAYIYLCEGEIAVSIAVYSFPLLLALLFIGGGVASG